jgi:hypothetical protein
MPSTRYSTVFFKLVLPCLLCASALLPPATPAAVKDTAVVGVLRFKSFLAGKDPSGALQFHILESARANARFTTPRQNGVPLWYLYEPGSVISPQNLQRYEELCGQLSCTHLLMGRIYSKCGTPCLEMKLYSSAEKTFLCAFAGEFTPGNLKKAAGQAALQVSRYLQGRLPSVKDLKISQGTSPSQVSLSWKSAGGENDFTISRASYESGPYAKIGETKSTRFVDTTAEEGIKYWYTVSVARDGLPGISAAGSGYRKPPHQPGLTADEMLDSRTMPWPAPDPHDSIEEREKENIRLKLFEKYYESPFMVTFIIMVGKMYINSGELIAYRDFNAYTWDPANRVIYLIKPGMPRIKFHSRRFFRFVRDVHDLHIPYEELLPRVIGNAILFCVRTDDREVRQADGRTKYLPTLEAVGMSTEYHRNYEKWRSNTIVFSTSTEALYKRILEAQRRGG